MNDLYYTKLTDRFHPDWWWGDSFQENAGFEEMYARVNSLDPGLVIDVGCARNKHKPYIKNLIGFDANPFPEADMHCPISEAPFKPNCADAILVLGSVQFISREYIIENMETIIPWVRPGGLIEMRTLFHDQKAKEFIRKFNDDNVKVPWDEELRKFLSDKYNLEYVIEPWLYDATASIELIEKRARVKERSLAKRELKRECWTWRKRYE